MAGVQWIKVATDLFDNRKIKYLRRLPDGDSMCLIWLMLLTLAGRCNAGGLIFLTEDMPYTQDMLADELGFEEDTIRAALTTLRRLGMVEETEDGFLCLPGWEEHQNTAGLEKLQKIRQQNRKRVSDYRARQQENENAPETADAPDTAANPAVEAANPAVEEDADGNATCNADGNAACNAPVTVGAALQVEKCNAACNAPVTPCNAVDKNKNRIEKNREEKENVMGASAEADNAPTPPAQTARRFSPPAVAEVDAYCRERGNGVDAQRFVDYYAARGWKLGKTTMKDWRAAVRTWENTGNCGARKGGSTNGKPEGATYAAGVFGTVL